MLDLSKQLEIFDCRKFGQRRVDIIGCGAVGSRLALELARHGVVTIHLWDFDKVEPHNLGNQAFGLRDIGRLKTEALRDLIKDQTGVEAVIHTQKVDEGTDISGQYVFLAVDSMTGRKAIASALENNGVTDLVIEARMGAESGGLYAFNPNNPAAVKAWRQTLHTDKEAPVSACGSVPAVGCTAGLVSSLAVVLFIQWFNRAAGKRPNDPEKDVFFSLRPLTLVTS